MQPGLTGGTTDMVTRIMDGDKMVPAEILFPPTMIKTVMVVTAACYF